MENNSFISNVNILVSTIETIQNINLNMQTIKKVESKKEEIEKIALIESQIVSIDTNISKLLMISNVITELVDISNNLPKIVKVHSEYDEFFMKYDEVKELVSSFRINIDEFFSSLPKIQKMHDDMLIKDEKIDKNILLAVSSASSSSSSAAVAVAAKNVIEEKYQVYLDVSTIKNQVKAVADNIQSIVDAITITTDAKNVTNQNALATNQDKNLVKQYKDETLNNRNITLNLKDLAVKTLDEMTPIVNQINRQTSSNSKLAFQVHSIATRLSIEFSSIITSIKKIQEEKELELNLFATNLAAALALEIANAKTIVSKDVVTSQKIVAEISDSLYLLTEAKNRENKNEMRFKNSELVSLIAVSKMMVENKIIDGNTRSQIEDLEIKLKDNGHEKNKSLLNSFTMDKRVELLVAKSLLTDIKLQTL